MSMKLINKLAYMLLLLVFLTLNSCTENTTKNNTSESEAGTLYDKEESAAIPLNNKAVSFDEYLYIETMYNASRVFYEKDKQGSYYAWQFPEDFFSIPSNIYSVFTYKDEIICEYGNNNQNSVLVFYNKDLIVQRELQIEGSFNPTYIYGDYLYGNSYIYGYGNHTSEENIISIDLNTLDIKEIYSYARKGMGEIDFIIGSDGKIIVYEINAERNKTNYFEYANEVFIPILETKLSEPICLDSRGLFYLETDDDFFIDSTSKADLMLWNGSSSETLTAIQTDDMNGWLFTNGVPGNIIITHNYIASIHELSEEPYVLIQTIGTQHSNKKPLKKWDFTEADIARNGETFSGIYYENGEIINYFFSDTAKMLQTQVITIE